MNGKSILISGGLGFIGLNLAKALRADNRVTLIDNLSSAQVQQAEGVKLHVGDVAHILPTLDPSEFDLFYHLGEYSRVEQSLDHFGVCMQANFGPLAPVLEFCRLGDVKLVYSGSSTKFTTGAVGKDLSPYTWSKSTNTDLVTRYADWYGLSYAICYFYNVFGPGEISAGAYATVIAKFLQAKQRGERVHITHPGTQVRNFTHIGDTIRALTAIGAHGQGDSHCIANPEGHSIVDVARMIGLDYDMSPANRANRMAAGYNLTKMEALGWRAEISLADYLSNAVRQMPN